MPSAPVSSTHRALSWRSASAAAIASRIAWSSALRLAGFRMVRRRTPSAGRSVSTSPLMPGKSSRPRRPAYSSTTSVSPSFTAWPSSQRISLTTPASSASTGISIFIDSRMTTVSPSSIGSPTWHSIFQTVPVMCASTSGTNVLLVGCARTIAARVDVPRTAAGGRGAHAAGPRRGRVRWRRERRPRAAAAPGGAGGPDPDPRAGLPRPAPGRDLRPVPRPRAHARAGRRLRGRAHGDLDLRVDGLPRAWDRARERPAERPGDPRPEPLVVHGPLLPGRVHPPQGPLHGEVAALQAAAAVHLLARRRLPGAARLPRRGDVRHRRGDPRARRLHRHVLRGRPVAQRADRRPRAARDRPARARVGRDDRARRDPRLRARAQLEAPAVPEGDRAVRRAVPLRTRGRAEPRPAAGRRRRHPRDDPRALRAARDRGARGGRGALAGRAAGETDRARVLALTR